MTEALSYRDVEPETVIESGELYERYHRLVHSTAFRYRRRAVGVISPEDLVQEGWVGVERAYRTFRTGQGATFNTHVGNHIKWAISSAIVRVRGHGAAQRGNERSFTSAGIDDPERQLVEKPRTGARRKDARALLHALTRRGSRRAKCVAFLYYFRSRTHEELGAKLGISGARVKQLVDSAFTGSATQTGVVKRRRCAARALELAGLGDAA